MNEPIEHLNRLDEPENDETRPALLPGDLSTDAPAVLPAELPPPMMPGERPKANGVDAGEAESVLYERLCGLIRELHREKQAAEIITAFDAAFASTGDEGARRGLLDYWLDFYRLQKYKHLKQRRRPKVRDRLIACMACGYPSSHRHHLWDFATHGENDVTINLCANCHEINHLMYNALVRSSDYSRDILRHVMFSGGVQPGVIVKILGWCLAVIRYEANNGWLDGSLGAKERVEARLSWTEFLRHTAHLEQIAAAQAEQGAADQNATCQPLPQTRPLDERNLQRKTRRKPATTNR